MNKVGSVDSGFYPGETDTGRWIGYAFSLELRWCLDVAFGEDQSRVRVDNAAQNFVLPGRIVMSLPRQDRITKT